MRAIPRHRPAQTAQTAGLALVRRLLDAVSPPAEPLAPWFGDSETTCTTCGRSHGEVTHMIAGGTWWCATAVWCILATAPP